MDFLEKLTPENVRAFLTCFLMGYVFRSVERGIRDAGKEEDLRTVVMSVVWSVILSATLLVVKVDFPSYVPKDWRTSIYLASLVLYAAAVGVLWALTRPLFIGLTRKVKRAAESRPSLNHILHPHLHDRADEQNRVRFFKDEAKPPNQVVVTLKGGTIYAGCVASWESSSNPEQQNFTFTLAHVYFRKKGEWELMPVDRMLFRLEDVETLGVVKVPAKDPEVK